MQTSHPIAGSGDILVLVLDEDQEVCRLVTQALTENNCRVACLPLHHQPHLLVRELKPDLIVLDISLPDGHGVETLRRLQAQRDTRKIPVIVTSSRAELEYELLEVFDFLLKPISILRLLENVALVRRSSHSGTLPYGPLTDPELRLFQAFLLTHSGLHFDQRNLKILERGLTHRMRALNARDYRAYHDYLVRYHESRQELKKLLGLLTIGETFFFRYLAHFTALEERIIPELLVRNRASRTLRIWSAGCSTGEEPYTIAMLLLERFPQLADWDVSILATDINKRALARARDAFYSERSLRLAPPLYLERYFRKTTGGFVLEPRVRDLVRFAYFNLQTGSYPAVENGTCDLDLIFCRNVMIYFGLPTTRAVVERFSRCLRPGGHFFMGHAETLLNISDAFIRQQHQGGFYYRLKETLATIDTESQSATAQFSVPAPAATAVSNVFPAPESPRPTPKPPVPDTPPEPPAVDIPSLLAEADQAFSRENFRTASRIYDMILRSAPEHVEATIGKGFILANEGDYAGALDCCARALQTDDLCANAYFLRGLILDLLEDPNKAIAEYRKALLLDLGFIMPHYNLSKIYWRQGRFEEAQRQLKNTVRLLEKQPEDTPVPHSGGLTRAVFLEICREDSARYGGLVANR